MFMILEAKGSGERRTKDPSPSKLAQLHGESKTKTISNYINSSCRYKIIEETESESWTRVISIPLLINQEPNVAR